MAEGYIARRVVFSKGGQGRFLKKVLQSASVHEIAKACAVSSRTIRDWLREKFLIDGKSLKILCKKTHMPFPKGVKLVDSYWYALKGAKHGWEAVKKKYGKIPGNEEYRKEKWFEWWQREGKHKKAWRRITQPIVVKHPKYSKRLAEFVGAVLGDGGMTRYQLVITLNKIDDKEYSHYLSSLIFDLFKVRVHFSYRLGINIVMLVVSRSALVKYCVEQLEMKVGNKVRQQTGVPSWIQRNLKFRIACARGLLDTDGSLFRHKYKVGGKMYEYYKFDFTNRSKPLTDFVFNVFQEIGLNPRRTKDNYSVRLDSQKSVIQCFKRIKPANPKYLKKYRI